MSSRQQRGSPHYKFDTASLRLSMKHSDLLVAKLPKFRSLRVSRKLRSSRLVKSIGAFQTRGEVMSHSMHDTAVGPQGNPPPIPSFIPIHPSSATSFPEHT